MAKEKILIVDDEEHIVELLKFNLLNAGYDVFTANDGIDAVKIAKAQKPGLMLLVPDSALVAGHGFCIGVSGACSGGCAQGLLDLGERHGVIDRGGRSVLLACAIIVIGEVDGGLACVLVVRSAFSSPTVPW